MSVIVRQPPAKADPLESTAFKLFFPRELTQDQAREVWSALNDDANNVLADPFALEGVSTVFPGVRYSDTFYDLESIAEAVDAIGEREYLEDSWIELWVPEALEDQAEALDVTDLTQPPSLEG